MVVPRRTLLRWGGAGIRFLIGEQSPENSHFVPARRVSVADSTSCLFRRQTIVPSFVYRASRLEKNGAHRCSKTSERIVPRASSRVCVQNRPLFVLSTRSFSLSYLSFFPLLRFFHSLSTNASSPFSFPLHLLLLRDSPFVRSFVRSHAIPFR